MFGIFYLVCYVTVKLSVHHESDKPQNRRHSRSKRWEKHSNVKKERKEGDEEKYIRRSVLIFTRTV